MKELYDDLEDLCEVTGHEIGEAVDKIKANGNKISAGDIDVIDKLAHTMKSIKTTMAMMDAEDGASYGYGSYARDGRSYDGGSYARRRRDSMGRYSRRAYDDGYDRMEMMDRR